MNESEITALKKNLRAAVPPLQKPELTRDLWPGMLHRFDQRSLRVSWFDWALLGALFATILFFPNVIPALLYHF